MFGASRSQPPRFASARQDDDLDGENLASIVSKHSIRPASSVFGTPAAAGSAAQQQGGGGSLGRFNSAPAAGGGAGLYGRLDSARSSATNLTGNPAAVAGRASVFGATSGGGSVFGTSSAAAGQPAAPRTSGATDFFDGIEPTATVAYAATPAAAAARQPFSQHASAPPRAGVYSSFSVAPAGPTTAAGAAHLDTAVLRRQHAQQQHGDEADIDPAEFTTQMHLGGAAADVPIEQARSAAVAVAPPAMYHGTPRSVLARTSAGAPPGSSHSSSSSAVSTPPPQHRQGASPSTASSAGSATAVPHPPAATPAVGPRTGAAGGYAAAAAAHRVLAHARDRERAVMIQTPIGHSVHRPASTVTRPRQQPLGQAHAEGGYAGQLYTPAPVGAAGAAGGGGGRESEAPTPLVDRGPAAARSAATGRVGRAGSGSGADHAPAAGASASAGSSGSGSSGRPIVLVNKRAYLLKDQIGKGGSCIVYRAIDDRERVCALKRVKLDAVDELTRKSYIDEAELLSRLNGERCKGVIKLFDWEVSAKYGLVLIMEVGQMDMHQLLQRRAKEPLDLNFVRYYFGAMVTCVHEIHRFKVIHADLKPANFLLIDGRVALIDFGIAKAVAEGADTTKVSYGTQVGTVTYMSPEAINGTDADTRESESATAMRLNRKADVWSLGCILYQMVYGEPPFTQKQLPQRMAKIIDPNHQIAYPAIRRGSAPRALVPRESFDAEMRQAEDDEAVQGSGAVQLHLELYEPIDRAIDAMRRCLERNREERCDTEYLLAHPFLMPERYQSRCEGCLRALHH